MKSEETKNKIIETTIALIENQDGDVSKITIRKIAEKAGIGTGLINHYFGTKDNLIEVCVQTIIQKVVYCFEPEETVPANGVKTDAERVKRTVRYVMNFLFENPQISYISILGDFKNPRATDNSTGTVRGFAYRMSKGNVTESYLEKAFSLVAMMQSCFVKKEILREICHIDLDDRATREAYTDQLVDRVMVGVQ